MTLMSRELIIEHTKISELDAVCRLYESAIDYQKRKGFPVWQQFDRSVLVDDMETCKHYKVVIDDGIAMVFSLLSSDEIIWRHMEKGDAVYLHRRAVNPACKGRRLFSEVVDWTIDYAMKKGLKFIRMDTWSDNLKLINYYSGFGFRFVERFTTPDSLASPTQNRNLSLALLERKL
jgi:ribosomal protein S18 acetylase RimI-like enzyme